MLVAPSITVLLVLYFCDVCLTIRVPIDWNSGISEVRTDNEEYIEDVPTVETFKPPNSYTQSQKAIPREYFQYTAKKPQFAVDIAEFHGVQDPQRHYTAYPVKPYTGKQKPDLGKHRILDQNRPIYKEFQKYVVEADKPKEISSVSSNYEVFHPYKNEEPALQELYKDPILDKIRNDIKDNKNRLQKYETKAEKPNISKDEYLESLDQTDRKIRPQHNYPANYEKHRPLRKPVYYQNPQQHYHRDNYLNRRFRNPWNHHSKVRPINYIPVKKHLQSLRQHHALKYDDEHNEYPQSPPPESFAEPPDGYDIYEKGQQKYKTLRDQLDESINESIKESKPTTYNKLELQNPNNGKNEAYTSEDDDEEEDFVPIKNYAQVRKTESFKHLPRKAAFDDADNLDEIKNAPRLKEAVKSTKAQTVYTEEGYEDTAYDHAGEQKHAGDHEGHGGYLREKELSGGKYKTPSVSADHENGGSTAYRDQLQDGKQWKDSENEHENENHHEDYTETDHEDSTDVDENDHLVPEESQNKESMVKNDYDDSADLDENDQFVPEESKIKEFMVKNVNKDSTEVDENDHFVSEESKIKESVVQNGNESLNNDDTSDAEHGVSKREVKFIVPVINLNTTFLSEKEILELAQEKIINETNDSLFKKYPYYFQNSKNILKDSPLRYAEDLKLIPLKKKSETAFYDSKSKLQCPDVDVHVDPIPENLKNGERPESAEENDSESVEDVSKKKSRLKGLGDKIDCFKAKYFGEDPLDSPFFNEHLIDNPEPVTIPNVDKFKLPVTMISKDKEIRNLKNSLKKKNDEDLTLLLQKLNLPLHKNSQLSINKSLHDNSHDPTKKPKKVIENESNGLNIRKKRETTFIYKPYKIIRDGKKNEPNRLQKHVKADQHIDSSNVYLHEKDQPVKRNDGVRSYINIGKNERTKHSKDDDNSQEITFINVDKRRGEPKYEIKVNNHKSIYAPVHDKKSMSIEDYRKEITNAPKYFKNSTSEILSSSQVPSTDSQKTSSSNSIKRIIIPTTTVPSAKSSLSQTDKDKANSKNTNTSDEDYEEYDSEEEEDEDIESKVTTTTTTSSPIRKKTRGTTTTTTTISPIDYDEIEETPKLKLVTRFRNTMKQGKTYDNFKENNKTKVNIPKNKNQDEPKYMEKKKKSTQSTLVTDTNTYADDDDDMRKEEVDALIGVKHNMDDYMPLYEKEIENSPKNFNTDKETTDNFDDDDTDSSTEEDDYDSSEEDDSEEEDEEETTTPQSVKQETVTKDEKPIFITKKIVERHEEMPSNKSSPHVTQFKQDFKEIEIIKKIPIKRKPNKNAELLELYKDQNLAKDVNKLKSVEVFKENLDLSTGPKHGGNYRSARVTLPSNSSQASKTDPITLPSRSSKLIEREDSDEARDVDLTSSRASYRNKSFKNQRAVDADLEDIEVKRPHLYDRIPKTHNSLKSHRAIRRKQKPEKLIELSEEHEEYEKNKMRGKNFKSRDSQNLHGGNYKNAKLVNLARDDTPPKDAKANAAAVLNSFAQVVPILTTTPAYILDPSKRMYYYVDT